MSFVKTWDESVPAGSEAILTGDDRIREFKYGIRERLAVDHNFKATEGADALIGAHNKASFIDQVTDIAAVAGATAVYGKTSSGKIELFLILSDSTVVQLTYNGKLNAGALDVSGAARGDLLIRGASVFARTALGASGLVLRSDGTDALWAAIQAGDIAAVNASALPAGAIIQSRRYETGSYLSCANASPWAAGNVAPSNSEGDQVMSDPFTPVISTSKIRIEVELNGNFDGTNIGYFWLLLDADTAARKIGAMSGIPTGAMSSTGRISFEYLPASAAQITAKVRASQPSVGYYFYLNGYGAAAKGGGKYLSSITWSEIKV